MSFAERMRSEVKERLVDVDFWISGSPTDDVAVISRIVVPKGKRGNGVGTGVMRFIVSEADREGMTIALSPSTDFGGSSKGRLEAFYGRFGFVPNRGANRDYRISESMLRVPREG